MSTASPSVTAEQQERRRVGRRNLLICAAFFALLLPAQPVLFGQWHPALMLGHGAWVVCFVLLGLGLGAGWIPERVAGSAAGLVSLATLTLCVHLSGGVASPYFPFLHTIPLVVTIFNPGERAPVWAAIVSTLGGLLLVMGLSGATTRFALAQLVIQGFVAMVSAYGGQTYRRLLAAEQSAQHERLNAQEQLTESERRRVQAERSRMELERLVVVGQLAAGVAHEINNPLAYVKSNLGFLQEELLRDGAWGDAEELRQILGETRQGVERIQQIVSDLRRFSREPAGADEECAVEDAVGEARRLASVRLLRLGEVMLDLAPQLPRVRVGQRHLVQVLVNLLLNAADAVESVPERRDARIVVRARPHETGVRVEVEDNGPGIPDSVLPRLFEPFFTTKPPGQGTGLGLALCREYLARAGGTVTAENLPAGGARFVLTLKPAASA